MDQQTRSRTSGTDRFETRAQHEERVARLERLAHKLDSNFRVPGTSIRFGYDSLLGLVPGFGDTLVMVPSAYIVQQAHALGVRRSVLARMAVNVGIDYVIGLVPLVGDIFDVGWKANRRNVAMLREELGLPPLPEAGRRAKRIA